MPPGKADQEAEVGWVTCVQLLQHGLWGKAWELMASRGVTLLVSKFQWTCGSCFCSLGAHLQWVWGVGLRSWHLCSKDVFMGADVVGIGCSPSEFSKDAITARCGKQERLRAGELAEFALQFSPTPASWSLSSTLPPWYTQAHTYIHKIS